VTATQCRNILKRLCSEELFRVIVLRGSGDDNHLDEDAITVAAALADLG
jgi:hypothetical protein